MNEIFVGEVHEFKDHLDRKIVMVKGKEVGVFRSNNQFYAFENYCPHAGGPVCEGVIEGKVEAVLSEERSLVTHEISDTEMHLICPWHGWTFNITNGGKCIADQKYKLRKFEVIERDNQVFLITN